MNKKVEVEYCQDVPRLSYIEPQVSNSHSLLDIYTWLIYLQNSSRQGYSVRLIEIPLSSEIDWISSLRSISLMFISSSMLFIYRSIMRSNAAVSSKICVEVAHSYLSLCWFSTITITSLFPSWIWSPICR